MFRTDQLNIDTTNNTFFFYNNGRHGNEGENEDQNPVMFQLGKCREVKKEEKILELKQEYTKYNYMQFWKNVQQQH